MSKTRQYIALLPLVLYIMILPVWWLRFEEILGFSIPIVGSLFALSVFAIIIHTSVWQKAKYLLRRSVLFFSAYALYIFVIVVAFPFSDAAGALVHVRFLFSSFIIFSCLVLLVVSSTTEQLARVIYTASIGGFLLFSIYVFFVFSTLGRNLFAELYRAVLSADLVRLTREFYVTIFNFSVDNSIAFGTTDWKAASLRNHLMAGLLVFLILLMAFRPAIQHRLLRTAGTVIAGICFLSVLFSSTRANISVLILVVIFVIVIVSLINTEVRPWRLVILTALPSLALFMIISGRISFFQGFFTILSERFSAVGQDPRLLMAAAGIEGIMAKPLLGNGVAMSVLGEHVSHNLFLGAWYEAGVFGFLASVLWVGAVYYYWIKTLITVIRKPKRWVLNVAPHWILALPILPMFRIWINGRSGNMGLPEWLCLVFFFGAITINQLELKKMILSYIQPERKKSHRLPARYQGAPLAVE